MSAEKHKRKEGKLLQHKLKIIISGGGTGGHIFPAVAIANAIKEKRPDTEILFVGAQGKMEMEKVPAAGYDIVGLNITGISRSLSLSNLAFPFRLLTSLAKARKIIKSFKPDVAVGVGGYASGPLLFAASLEGIPTLIQEQNSFAGITNRILGKRASKICVAFPGMEKFFPTQKIMITGNPVRKDMVKIEGKREIALKHFGLDPEKRTVLVVGGSQGARTLNLAFEKAALTLSQNNIQVIWQTGPSFLEKAIEVTKDEYKDFIKPYAFIKEMDLAYAAADLVVSRAGASTVSELCLVRKPSILVPYPFASEDHQTANAMMLADKYAAIHLADNEAIEKISGIVQSILDNPKIMIELSNNIIEFGIGNSADIIAEEVIKLAGK